MRFPPWTSASLFEPSSALVLILIGLGGFLVDLLVRPISPAGLGLLLLAATPSLVSILKRNQPPAPAANAPLAAGPAQRPALARPAAQNGSGAPAAVRGNSEGRAPEPGPQASKAAAPGPHDQQRSPPPARVQRRPDAEPVRQRAEPQAGNLRRPVEPPRNHPNAL